MPRKATKADKPALQFVERPAGGARLRNVPEVRAAVNPKDFFSETQTHNSSDLNAWVNPQFDCSAAAAPPKRRGRRRCQTATSLVDRCSQLSRKNSTCKYPSLSFHIGLKNNSQQQSRSTSTTKGAGSKVKNQARESVCRSKRTVSIGGYSDAPKRQLAKVREGNGGTLSEGAASDITRLDQPGAQPKEATIRCNVPAEGASTPASTKLITTEVNSVCLPPDVDTPKMNCFSPPPELLLFNQPPCSSPPDTLVADTPERDYGVKVTWRRRKGLMMILKERGHLSESDTLSHC
ncbi:RAD9, HUS1, RAD1-interacting nuclear orphan protein 1 [Fundulus heteroclitus]|uniref:RAD9, HUS1, RAD1-interacting nuclear orphan protein 1 n=1 Tax=Fundulus heteroclitus TaxID=8078 RepID=UPI00165B1047|nr:RAD9, HUS1, RAD1-interacting nuclear orphan protein 1 [Fundulus heteroclitus]XP_012734463.2 RAD9, HUS1, RAD1-interacting nuclear orphan protein 1 [Fundulus heteroclitus]